MGAQKKSVSNNTYDISFTGATSTACLLYGWNAKIKMKTLNLLA